MTDQLPKVNYILKLIVNVFLIRHEDRYMLSLPLIESVDSLPFRLNYFFNTGLPDDGSNSTIVCSLLSYIEYFLPAMDKNK